MQIFETPTLVKIIDFLLQFTIDNRPRIRKTAQKSIIDLIKLDDGPATVHPASRLVSKFLLETIEKWNEFLKIIYQKIET